METENKRGYLELDPQKSRGEVSPTLYGLFLEDINYSCDGGLNANLLKNYSFDDVYMKGKHLNMLRFVTKTAGRIKTLPDRLRYWECCGGHLRSGRQQPVAEGGWYATVDTDGECELRNRGYNGERTGENAISIRTGDVYECSFYVRNDGFEGSIEIFVRGENGEMLTSAGQVRPEKSWKKQTLTLEGKADAYGMFVVRLKGKGSVSFDMMSLINSDTWAKGDPRWSQGKMRKDLVEALKELRPTFLRFPGGCLVEGVEDGNEYQWKNSVGPLEQRRQDYNLWSTEVGDSGYIQSRQLGFYEFFLLSEDLGAEPLPVVWAGLNCQMRKRGKVEIDDPDFYERVVQNALDLIEYANGDPKVSPWARLRAEAGHPEPFNMKYIGIGNENFGEDYLKRFGIIKKAIDRRYPGITCIISAGGMAQGEAFDLTWKTVREKYPDVYVDEHMYKKPESLIRERARYDDYVRGGGKVFLGEWAAFDILNRKLIPNQFETALAEAAFLTGIEKNADVVSMTCYAPLLCMVDGGQWKHNLIYFNPKTLVRSVNYFVQQMYGCNIGKWMLETKEQLPDGVMVSATADKDAVYVKLVNTTDENMDMDMKISEFMSKEVRVTEYAADPEARNTLTFSGEAEEIAVPKTWTEETGETYCLKVKPRGCYVVVWKKAKA